MTQTTYRQTVLDWRREREEGIRKENGWLALSGLFWLKLGNNKIGSDPKNEIQLPDRLPALVGYFEFNGKSVSLRTNPGQKVNVNDQLVDFALLQPDISETPSFITLDSVRLVVIQRGNRMGIRMWDNEREERRSFPPRTWYEVNEDFRIPAHYTAYERPKMAFFPDLTGEKSEFPVDGYISFKRDGKDYRLDVSREDDGSFFVRFWDPTSESETYPTGRYIVAEADANGNVTLDFNYAYNPPCAFTDFATCVFAPEQNRLDFKVTAGETYQRH
ncbi:MAG: DUF1684 domain-containing protein [Chloroflexota bacterium]